MTFPPGWNQMSTVGTVSEAELFAAHGNAEAVAKIRAWCDSAAGMTCSHTTEAECRRCEVIKDCALAVRTLLPEVTQ
jgi:hypothetical protein